MFGRAGVTAAQSMPASSLHDWETRLHFDQERMHAGYVLECAGSCRAAMAQRLAGHCYDAVTNMAAAAGSC